MDFDGLDVAKLKSLAIENWRSAPELWPVKVLSLARTLDLERKQGGRKLDRVGGYITCPRAVRFQTPKATEDILGFASGAFDSGVSVWNSSRYPRPTSLKLRGTHSYRVVIHSTGWCSVPPAAHARSLSQKMVQSWTYSRSRRRTMGVTSATFSYRPPNWSELLPVLSSPNGFDERPRSVVMRVAARIHRTAMVTAS